MISSNATEATIDFFLGTLHEMNPKVILSKIMSDFDKAQQEVCKKYVFDTGLNFWVRASRPLPPQDVPTVPMAHYDAFRLHGWLYGRYILSLQSVDVFVSPNCEPSTPFTDIITEPTSNRY